MGWIDDMKLCIALEVGGNVTQTLVQAPDAQAAPFLVLEECPNTGNVPIAESSQTLQMNEAAGDDRGVQLASLVVKNEALVFVVQSSPRLGLLVALDLSDNLQGCEGHTIGLTCQE